MFYGILVSEGYVLIFRIKDPGGIRKDEYKSNTQKSGTEQGTADG